MSKLIFFNAWKNGVSKYFSRSSAQSYMGSNRLAMATSGACGSACGTGDDKPAPKPSACGTNDEQPAPKPSACGTGEENPTPKPTACGSACGAGDK